jgi:hypothetical protein
MRIVSVLLVLVVVGCGGGSSGTGDGGTLDGMSTEAGQHDGAPDTPGDGVVAPDGGGDGAPCTPTGSDVPDDQFADTNCDGIDGDETKAIFVAPPPIGSLQGDGSKAQPVTSLVAALQLAQTAGKDIYIAGGAYTEASPIVLVSGVSIYGGYDAANGWSRDDDHVPTITIGTAVWWYVMKADGIAATTKLDRISVLGVEGGQPGATSVALLALQSPGLVISNCTFQAALGTAGAAGLNGLNPSPVWTNGASGQTAICKTQSDHVSSNAMPQGGGGGLGCEGAQNGAPGDVADGAWPPGTGANGSDGIAGVSGTGGVPGQLNSTNGLYEPGAGTNGTAGQAGTGAMGGMGGGSSACTPCPAHCPNWPAGPCYALGQWNGAGGGGGGGGCGGGGAYGGKGGGASIGVVVVNSTLRISGSHVATNRGGAGGPGGQRGTGAAGGTGGQGGSGTAPSPGCTSTAGSPGGHGGKGGDGGHGGGGAGGPSVGIWIVGPATPTLANNTFDVRAGGTGGFGGDVNDTQLKGADGFSRNTNTQ